MVLENLKAEALKPEDFEAAADALKVPLAALKAVWKVESRARSYDSKGRLTMLFEPHVFYRQLKTSRAKLIRAIDAGLAYARWRNSYPQDSYPRLLEAMKIDEEAALRAASWGGPQILGENYAVVGYRSAKFMVENFLTGEPPQLRAFVKFIQVNRLDDDLRRKDWAGFARGYNGAGQVTRYAKLLRAAYRSLGGK
ncbi:MAG: DUF3380 domain-containing protein [Dehalococcoidia bacterium]|nr:MAG: DUF3380 domain-containing protein [Dehalococcoidia bacterium]